MTKDIAKNLAIVQETIKSAAENAQRKPNDVTLVAVSKTHPSATIEWALKSGHRVFGENKVQEAEDKWPNLKLAYSDISLHLIGPLQSNKVMRAVLLFDVIETLDRLKIANALARESLGADHHVKISHCPPGRVSLSSKLQGRHTH